MTSLNQDFASLLIWFYKNFMVLSADKCSFMLFGGVKDELQTDLVSNSVIIKNSKEENELGITFDSNLDLSTTHLISIAKKASITFNALTRVKRKSNRPS